MFYLAFDWLNDKLLSLLIVIPFKCLLFLPGRVFCGVKLIPFPFLFPSVPVL